MVNRIEQHGVKQASQYTILGMLSNSHVTDALARVARLMVEGKAPLLRRLGKAPPKTLRGSAPIIMLTFFSDFARFLVSGVLVSHEKRPFFNKYGFG